MWIKVQNRSELASAMLIRCLNMENRMGEDFPDRQMILIRPITVPGLHAPKYCDGPHWSSTASYYMCLKASIECGHVYRWEEESTETTDSSEENLNESQRV